MASRKRKMKRRVKWFVLKTVVKLVLLGGTVAGVAAAAKKAQGLLGGLTGK